jgi:hypothetical protein
MQPWNLWASGVASWIKAALMPRIRIKFHTAATDSAIVFIFVLHQINKARKINTTFDCSNVICTKWQNTTKHSSYLHIAIRIDIGCEHCRGAGIVLIVIMATMNLGPSHERLDNDGLEQFLFFVLWRNDERTNKQTINERKYESNRNRFIKTRV